MNQSYTDRDYEILKRLSSGSSLKELQGVVFMSQSAIKHRLREMRKDSGCKNTVHLVAMALRSKLIQ